MFREWRTTKTRIWGTETPRKIQEQVENSEKQMYGAQYIPTGFGPVLLRKLNCQKIRLL